MEQNEIAVMKENQIKLLMIDDNEEFTNTCAEYFKTKDICINVANNALTGIKKFREETPDVVILDYKMPRLSGYETMQKIKRLNSKVKIIFLTAYEDELILTPNEQKKIPYRVQTM